MVRAGMALRPGVRGTRPSCRAIRASCTGALSPEVRGNRPCARKDRKRAANSSLARFDFAATRAWSASVSCHGSPGTGCRSGTRSIAPTFGAPRSEPRQLQEDLARRAVPAARREEGVGHGDLDVAVAEPVLDDAEVGTGLELVRGYAVLQAEQVLLGRGQV